MESQAVYVSDVSKDQQEIATKEADISSDILYLGSATYLAVLTIVAFFANTFVIIVFIKERQLQTPINVILLNLSFCDLGIASVGTTISFVNSLHYRWAFSEEVCQLYALVMSLCGICSITTLAVLAFWRSLVIAMPIGRKWNLTLRQSKILIFFIWFYAAGVTAPPAFGWGKFGEEYGGISCSVSWRDSSPSTTTYVLYLFAFGLMVPLLFITVAYCSIVRVVNKKTSASRTRAQARVTIMIGIMVSAFLFSWTPYSIIALVETFGNPERFQLHPSFVTIPSLFAKSCVIFNPFIYAGLNTQFQHAARRMFGIQASNQMTSKIDISGYQVQGLRTRDRLGISSKSIKDRVSSDHSNESLFVMTAAVVNGTAAVLVCDPDPLKPPEELSDNSCRDVGTILYVQNSKVLVSVQTQERDEENSSQESVNIVL